MAILLADNAQQVSTSEGTGSFTLVPNNSGTLRNLSDALDISSGESQETAYWIQQGLEFEGGVGTVTAGSPDTLSRDTVKVSSNNNNLVDFGEGEKVVSISMAAWMFNNLVNNIFTVVQEKEASTTSELRTNSTSFENIGLLLNITPIFDDSLIEVRVFSSRSQTALLSGGNTTNRILELRVRNETDGVGSRRAIVGPILDGSDSNSDIRINTSVSLFTRFTVNSKAQRTFQLQGRILSADVEGILSEETFMIAREIRQ